MRTTAIISLLMLTACEPSETEKYWAGTVVVRICRDGTNIYRLPDGRFFTGGYPRLVERPETVCSQ